MKKKSYSIILSVVFVGIVASAVIYQKLHSVPYIFATVQQGTIIEEVSASGKVEAPMVIDLRFKNSGRLVLMDAVLDKNVVAGKLLAQQDTTQLDAQVKEMQANRDVQVAKLAQLNAGTSPEDLAITQTAVLNAETSVAHAQQSLLETRQQVTDSIQDAYTKADDAVRNKADQLFTDSLTYDPQLVIRLRGLDAWSQEVAIESKRASIEYDVLIPWKSSIMQVKSDADLLKYTADAKEHLYEIQSFLDLLARALNNSETLYIVGGTEMTMPSNWKNDISTARNNIQTAITTILGAENKLITSEASIETAKGVLTTTQNQRTQKEALARPDDIAVLRAQITQAEASLQKTLAQRADLFLYAPTDAVITKTRAEVGEVVGPDTNIISLASGDAFQIELSIIEDKIVKVKVGQTARISFDAISGEQFTGTVVSIDQAETMLGGAVYYQSTILFDTTDERIRSGMSATVWIETDISENTLYVPASALQHENGGTYVEKYVKNEGSKQEVQTGIANDAGMIEIISGLASNDTVILNTGTLMQ